MRENIAKIILILSGWVIPLAGEGQLVLSSKPASTSPSTYVAKDYKHLLGMPGFNDHLLNMHFKLYQGYVTNSNLLLALLSNMTNPVEFGALKRRLGWEFNGMLLHELYFENLGGKTALSTEDPLYKGLTKEFGTFDAWKKDFIATGMMRGIGWAVLYRDAASKKLLNVWINEHDLGHLAGGTPILIMDVFEHAYMPQYDLDRNKYIDAFFQNIDWNVASKRYMAK